MKTLYLDCFSGASGDMLLGALLDLGLSPVDLQIELKKLHLPEKWHLHLQREQRLGLEGFKLSFHEHEHCEHHHDHSHAHEHEEHTHHHGQAHHHDHEHGDSHHAQTESSQAHSHHDKEEAHSHGRDYRQIVKLLQDSDLSETVIAKSMAVFHRIAVAEGKIHGRPPEEVHFHEVGALDSILDIVGFCAGMERLGLEQVHCSFLVEGSGWVDCAHGRFPVPAPATVEILKGQTLRQTDEPHELITPTGAALLAEFSLSFGLMPALQIEKIGYGLGSRQLKSRPNVVRAILGTLAENSEEQDRVTVLETNLDDISGETLGYAQDKLFQAGALDVYSQPIQMKKGRPGVILSVLCEPALAASLTEIILTQTTAFGVRATTAYRTKLQREIKRVSTPWGEVEVKVGQKDGKTIQLAPEFESCRKIADQTGQPLSVIYQAARQAAQALP
jgi:uncharacterized protein (TIGR00299 family) protein